MSDISTWQTIHMKCRLISFEKEKDKNEKVSSAANVTGAVRVNKLTAFDLKSTLLHFIARIISSAKDYTFRT